MFSILAVTLAGLSSSSLAQSAPKTTSTQPQLQCRLHNKETGPFCTSLRRTFDSPQIPDCCVGVNAEYCEACHSNGCDQCCDHTFKPDFCTPCTPCKEYDPNALFCTDFYGSQQCKPGCELKKVPRSATIFADSPHCPDDCKGATLHICVCDEDDPCAHVDPCDDADPCVVDELCEDPCLASLNVAFLVDGSGSINAPQFEQEVDAVNEAIDLLSGKSQAMVIQFASQNEFVIEQDLELADIIGVLNFQQKKGQTFWVEPMQVSIDALNGVKTDDNASLLVLITDGENQDANLCGPCANGVCGGVPLLVMAVDGAVIKPCYTNSGVNNKIDVDDFAQLKNQLDTALRNVCSKKFASFVGF